MPQTSVVFTSILGPNCNRQVQPGMGERGGGASSGSKDLIFQDGRLTSGSLEALMEHLVPTVDYYPDVRLGPEGAGAASNWEGKSGLQGRLLLGGERGPDGAAELDRAVGDGWVTRPILPPGPSSPSTVQVKPCLEEAEMNSLCSK